MAYWTSKLGNKYLKAELEQNERETKRQLDSLRRQPANRMCADCGIEPTVWSSVNLGVFLCIRCGSLHRGIGTHISVPKGCTGTYFWGKDEIDNMTSIGNKRAETIYGGNDVRPNSHASDEAWRKFIVDKYYHRKFSATDCRSMGAEPGKSSTRSEGKDSSKQMCPTGSQLNPTSKVMKYRRSKPSKRSIATSVPSFTSNVPVGDLLDFDSEVKSTASEPRNSTNPREVQLDSIDSIQNSNETAIMAEEPSPDDFFAHFGV